MTFQRTSFLSALILLGVACSGGSGNATDSGAGTGGSAADSGAGGTAELDTNEVADLVHSLGNLDGVADGTDSKSADDCPTLVGCIGDCAEGVQGCIDECAAAANSEALDALSAVVDCATSASCEDDGCLQESCGPEIGVCAGAAVGPVAGAADCVTLVDCTGTCDDGDDACLQTCAGAASSEAITAYDALLTCASAAGCADQTCVEQNCEDELLACANVDGSGGSGGSSGAGGSGDTGGTSGAGGTSSTGGTGGADTGVSSSGSCDSTSLIPNGPALVECWDYELTATETSNSGVENYYYYDAMSTADGQELCAEEDGQMFSSEITPGATPQQISARNATNKENACNGFAAGGSTVTWTDGGSCNPAGALGHCTRTVTNTITANGTITSTVETVWE